VININDVVVIKQAWGFLSFDTPWTANATPLLASKGKTYVA